MAQGPVHLLTSSAVIAVDVEYSDCTLEAHALLRDAHDRGVVFAERNTLHGGREFPGV